MRATGFYRQVLIGSVLTLVACGVAVAATRDPADFPSQHARCMVAKKGRIITSVGSFPSFGRKNLEVVADTRLSQAAASIAEYEDPSISVFDSKCEMIWHQSYPSFSEVGFKALPLTGRTMLFVSAISVFEPVDQTISDEELVSSADNILNVELSFGSDRYDVGYLGNMGTSGGFGLVTVHTPGQWHTNKDTTPLAITGLVYRWTSFSDPDDPAGAAGHLFVGPEQINAKQVRALKLPASPMHPPFPLYKFLTGEDDPG